jgi:hypothetical protein
MAIYYWVGGNGTWDSTTKTNWATSSGGAGGFGPPTSADTASFDANSGTAATVTVASTAAAAATTVNKADINLSLSGNATLTSATGSLTLTTGTLTLNSYTLTCGVMNSNNANTRTIAFGTGGITLTGNNGIIWYLDTTTNLTLTGSRTVTATYSGSTGTRTFYPLGGVNYAINLSITAGSDIISTGNGYTYLSLNFTGFSGSYGNFTTTMYGDITFSSGMTLGAGTNALTFAATSGTTKITTNGKTLDFPLTQNSPGATVQLQDNLTMGSTRAYTLTAGTLDLSNGNRTLSTGTFASSGASTRAIAFGTGNVTLTGNAATIWNTSVAGGFTYTGTPKVISNYSGATGTRTIAAGASSGGTETNTPSFYITAGTDIVNITHALIIDLTGFAGTFSNVARNLYGDLVIPSGVTVSAGALQTIFRSSATTQNIDVNAAITLDFPIRFGVSGTPTYKLLKNLTLGSIRTAQLYVGTLDLNNQTLTTGLFDANVASTRAILFGTGNITTTGSGAVWQNAAANFSYTGTPTVNISNNSATATTVTTGAMTEAQSLNFNYTTGTYTLTDTSAVYKSVNFTGFTGTIPNSVRTIYGSLTLVSGMTLTAGTNATTFASTAAGNTITSAGKKIDFPLIFNGIGGSWTFQDALNLATTQSLTLTNGTLNLKAGSISVVGSFITNGTNQKYLGSSTPGTQATISDASGVNSVSYLTISDSFATGGATWDAFYGNNNVDFGNNTNWDFGESPVLGNEYEYKLRSMTERRRF